MINHQPQLVPFAFRGAKKKVPAPRQSGRITRHARCVALDISERDYLGLSVPWRIKLGLIGQLTLCHELRGRIFSVMRAHC